MNEVVQNSVVAVSSDKPRVVDVKKIRKTGIPVIGDAPWGTHFCQFYQTKEDLIHVLVPYFKAGLENNEFCLWVTSEPLHEKEAEEAMRKAVPDFDLYLKRGQIEIVPHTEWYLKDGVFNLQRVLNAWINKLEQALAKGYDGLRVTGNTAWLEKKDWKNFTDYEEQVNSVIGKYQMIVICTYLLDRCGASEVIDVVRNHQFALIRRGSEWELIESSELKRAKEQIQAAEESLQNTLDNMLEGCQIIGYDWRYLYINDAVVKHGRTTKERLLGKTMMEVYPGIEKTEMFSKLQQCMKERLSTCMDNEFTYPDGEKRWFELSIQPVPEGIFILSIDITKRKTAEEKIRRVSEEWSRTFDAISDFVFIIDHNYRFVRVNKALCDVLKKEPEELIGKRCFEVLHGTDKPWPNCPHTKTLATGEAITEEINDPNLGLPLLVTNCPIFDNKGELAGAVHLAKDITERKKTEEELKRYSEYLENIFAASPDAITVSDLNGNVIQCNQATLDLLGFSLKEELVGKNGFSFIVKRDRQKAAEYLKKTFEQGSVKNAQYTFLTKDGHEIQAELSASVIRDASGNPTGFVSVTKDITERKEAEESLRESEQRFRCLVEDAAAGVGIIDLKGRFTYVNKKLADSLGYSVQELAGHPFKNYLHPDDEGKIVRLFLKSILLRMPLQNLEFQVIHKDGHVLHCISKPTRLIIDGKTVGFQAIITDITERKRIEDMLQKSESKYRTLLENVPQKIFLKDRNSVYVSCNENYARDLKIKSNEITGKTDYDFYPKELAEKYRADDKRIMEFEETQDIEEEYLQNGQRVYVHTIKTPVKDENDNVVGVLGIFWDITERRLMEQKYSTIIKTALDGFWINDNKGRLIAVNDAYCRMIGYTREELLSMSILDIEVSEKPEETVEHIQKIMKEGYDRFETRQRRKDGIVIDVEVSTTYYPVGEGQLVVFLHDITEHKKMEEQLKEYSAHLEGKIEERSNQLKKVQEQLLKAEKMAAIGEVATMVGHDLRNPLQAMVNTLYLAGKKSESIPITEKEILEKHGFLELRSGLIEQAGYMDKIVSDLQDYARLLKPIPVQIGLNQLINKTLSSLIVPENVKVSIVIEKGFPKLMLDPLLMQRAFSNLIANAVQAMPNGGQLTLRASKKEETALISVEDTGIGIPDENLSKLFKPLFTTKAKGQGFGLAVCMRMVEAHGGTITVESKVGQGSTFTVEIPLRKEVGQK